ncbi:MULTISPECIES: IPExxxVDY family protein [Flagellimonas]|uniref:IPExxxVDY family protein n=1 Tax=Flagellimonas hadalis TaxID=2597517 RepID=A0A5N5IR71_9FLAO|nr:IPExxxVDY family protein [Allomuricauda hadalis]KAB5490707.1 IPExxxVDY family protein [Allomuricauda hadalis]RUA15199.1 MAG: IPExxxVDY family protein [Flavobacteriia bacterium]
MMTTHRISADLYDDSFRLIAIHSDLEDYAMTYAINSKCGLYLKRMKIDLHLDENLSFSVFDWDDGMNDIYWTLISNKCVVEEVIPSGGLFENNVSARTDHLIKERKEIDYFLKVEAADEATLSQKLRDIKKIDRVITAYPLETQTLKSKRNLIF